MLIGGEAWRPSTAADVSQAAEIGLAVVAVVLFRRSTVPGAAR